MTKIVGLMAAATLAVAGSFAMIGGAIDAQDGSPTATTGTPDTDGTGTPTTGTPTGGGSPTVSAGTTTPAAASTATSVPVAGPDTGMGTPADGDGLGLLWLIVLAPAAAVGTFIVADRLRRA